MKKVCVVTGTRAEYGLLYWLMQEIKADKELQLQLIATGMHLSPEFGLTYKEIEKEFKINKKIEILISGDSPISLSKAMGLAQISFCETYEDLKPDILVLIGDRFEIFAAAAAALPAQIPIAHIHGGECTFGAIDESLRHCITKLSHLHFTSTEEYRKRVIQLGEDPERVFNVGALGVEHINRISLLNREEFEDSINFRLGKKNILVTYHPETIGKKNTRSDFSNILKALDQQEETHLIFTKANADTNGRVINHMIDNYVAKNQEKSCCFQSLGQLRYLSALKHVDIVLGNSSSGIIEAPSFKIPTINIGQRQEERTQAKTIINCSATINDIQKALSKALSLDFKKSLLLCNNPYSSSHTSRNIVDLIKKAKLENIVHKRFYNL